MTILVYTTSVNNANIRRQQQEILFFLSTSGIDHEEIDMSIHTEALKVIREKVIRFFCFFIIIDSLFI